MIFTNEEMVDMLLIYGECFQNAKQPEQRYAISFPETHHPTRPTFTNIVTRLREAGSLSPRKRIRNKTVINEAAEVAVLAAVAINPHASSRQMEREIGTSRTRVLRILHRHLFHSFHISLHQALDDNDFPIRLEYSQWVLHQGHDFMSGILFTDEATFTNHENVNVHNMYFWAIENPHSLGHVQHRQWSVDVWCGIVGHHIIDGRLNGGKYYRRFLRRTLPVLMEDLPLILRQVMWYQHDGCPAHNAVVVRNALNQQFPNRCILFRDFQGDRLTSPL